MDFGIENIERLIHELYHNKNSSAQTEANQVLTRTQMSSEAWALVWSLLDPNKSVEVQYFGASTLYLKIAKCFHELDYERQSALRPQLLHLLVSYLPLNGLKIVETRIAVALAAYVIQSVATHWENAVSDLVNTLQPSQLNHLPVNRVLQVLVELLSTIPEEFQTIYLTQCQRILIRSSLLKFNEQVFAIIHAVLSESQFSGDLKQSAIKCFSNWSQNTGPLILPDNHEELVSLVLESISDDNLSQVAVETLTAIYSHPEMQKQPNLVLKLIDKMVILEALLNQSIVESNQDIVNTIYTLFIQVAETHSRLLLDTLIDKPEHRNNILKVISIILQCSATPGYYSIDETCSEQAFNFWYTLQDDIIASDESRIAAYLTLFNPLFQSLIDAFLVKVQCPSDEVYENEWSSYDKESFRCYRQDIGDSFMYCYNILRVSMLTSLLSHFNVAANQLSSRLESNPCNSWQYLEAVLYTFSSIAENVDVEEAVYLPQIFNSLQSIPFAYVTSPRLLSTAMETLAAYSEWISNNSHFMPNIISLIMIGLKSHHSVTISATMALKDITRECQLIIKPYAKQILCICEESLNPDSNLKLKEKSRIMCTVGLTLSVLPLEEIMIAIERLLSPVISDIHNVINQCDQQTANIENQLIKTHISSQLTMLAMIFSTLDVNLKRTELEEGDQPVCKSKLESSALNNISPQPIYLILEKVLPLFANIGYKWAKDEDITESLCDCIKKAVTTLLDDIKPLVSDILQLLLYIYSVSRQTSILDISKQLLILFGRDIELQNYLTKFFIEICNNTMNQCQQDLRQQTALLETFYSSLTSLIKKVPIIFKSEQLDVSALFRCALTALTLPEKPTVRYCSAFISEFINLSREFEPMNRVVNNEAENLVGQTFLVIGGTCDSPRNVVEHMADIIMSLNQKYFDNLTRSMNGFVQKDGFPTVHVNKDVKTHFVRQMLTQRKNKRKLKEIINEFSLTCRGLIGTEYGNRVIKLPF